MSDEKNIIDEMEEYSPSILDFTKRSEEYFYDTVDLKDFRDKEAEYIYDCLRKNLRLIPFCDYLKRYIFIKSGMTDDYRQIDLREYQEIIIESFRENNTPPSFSDTAVRITALARNWLTQESVKRQIVFLLGFGLNMSVDDVSSFLLKAQKERDFNFKDPIEIIYWYCFKNGLKFSKMLKLKEAFDSLSPNKDNSIYEDKTTSLRDKFRNVMDDQLLLKYLSDLKTDHQNSSYSVTSYKWFSDLYMKCKEIIAGYYNNDEADNLEKQIQEYLDEVSDSLKLSDSDKKSHIEKMRETRKIWGINDITESDVEKILCCGTPIDDNGNLSKLTSSTLSKHFINKRLGRKHLGEVIDKKVAVDRFDLITLNFFIFSQNDKYKNNESRYISFFDNTNEILNECSMGELYIGNPYECFLLMCIVSDAPFPTYSEVLEKSFEE